jgi:hypothetical protein
MKKERYTTWEKKYTYIEMKNGRNVNSKRKKRKKTIETASYKLMNDKDRRNYYLID